jgi:hypothetical protein
MPKSKRPTIPLPKGWKPLVRSAVLHVLSLAHFSIVRARGWAADSVNTRVRLTAENDRLRQVWWSTDFSTGRLSTLTWSVVVQSMPFRYNERCEVLFFGNA